MHYKHYASSARTACTAAHDVPNSCMQVLAWRCEAPEITCSARQGHVSRQLYRRWKQVAPNLHIPSIVPTTVFVCKPLQARHGQHTTSASAAAVCLVATFFERTSANTRSHITRNEGNTFISPPHYLPSEMRSSHSVRFGEHPFAHVSLFLLNAPRRQ